MSNTTVLTDEQLDRIESALAEDGMFTAYANLIHVPELVDDLRAARAENARLRAALTVWAELHEDGDCRYDHHGACQEHYLGDPCIVAETRAALKEG